jgi:hypothetical protein
LPSNGHCIVSCLAVGQQLLLYCCMPSCHCPATGVYHSIIKTWPYHELEVEYNHCFYLLPTAYSIHREKDRSSVTLCAWDIIINLCWMHNPPVNPKESFHVHCHHHFYFHKIQYSPGFGKVSIQNKQYKSTKSIWI